LAVDSFAAQTVTGITLTPVNVFIGLITGLTTGEVTAIEPFTGVVVVVNGLVIVNWLTGNWLSPDEIEPADVIVPELVTDTGTVVAPDAWVVPEVKVVPVGKVALGMVTDPMFVVGIVVVVGVTVVGVVVVVGTVVVVGVVVVVVVGALVIPVGVMI
jgi:hypothetical protein